VTRLYLCGAMSGLPEKNYPAFHAEAARLRASAQFDLFATTTREGDAHAA